MIAYKFLRGMKYPYPLKSDLAFISRGCSVLEAKRKLVVASI